MFNTTAYLKWSTYADNENPYLTIECPVEHVFLNIFLNLLITTGFYQLLNKVSL